MTYYEWSLFQLLREKERAKWELINNPEWVDITFSAIKVQRERINNMTLSDATKILEIKSINTLIF